jgi:RND family efflux transporter MFP subunit
MKRRLAILLIFPAVSLLPIAKVVADPEPSVLVQVMPLTHGSLPRTLTVYGTVGSASAERRALMAPLQAAVTDVYVQNGEQVAKGAPLVRLVPSPASVAAYAQATSALQVASSIVVRTRSLVNSHLATDQELIQAEKNAADAKSALAALKAEGAQGPNTLRAPFSAIVTDVATTPGAIVDEGAGLVELVRPSGLVLKARVVPNEALSIHVNDPVKLEPFGGGPAVEGRVAFRSAVVDAANGLVPVSISLPQGASMLGQMFRAEITVGQIHGYVVPHAAILVNDAGDTYIVQSHNLTAREIIVQVLGADDNKDVISGSLEAGAPVVLAGNYQLDNGMKMRLSDGKAVAPKAKSAP